MAETDGHVAWLELLAPFGSPADFSALQELVVETEAPERWGLIADEGARQLRATGRPATALLLALHLRLKHGTVVQEALNRSITAICDQVLGAEYGHRGPDSTWVQRTVGWALLLRRIAGDLTCGSGKEQRLIELLCCGLELLAVSYDSRQRHRCTALDNLIAELLGTQPQVAARIQLIRDGNAEHVAEKTPASVEQIEAWQKELRDLSELLEHKMAQQKTRGLPKLAQIQLDNSQRVLRPLYERLFADDTLTDEVAAEVRSLDAADLLDRHPIQLAAAGARKITGGPRRDTIKTYEEITLLLNNGLRVRENLEHARVGSNLQGRSVDLSGDNLARILLGEGIEAKHSLLIRVLEGSLLYCRGDLGPLPVDLIWHEKAVSLRWAALFAIIEPETLARLPLEVLGCAGDPKSVSKLVAGIGTTTPAAVDPHDRPAVVEMLDRICGEGYFREAKLWLSVVDPDDRAALEAMIEQRLSERRRAVLEEVSTLKSKWVNSGTKSDLELSFDENLFTAKALAESGFVTSAQEIIASAKLVLSSIELSRKERSEERQGKIRSALGAIRQKLTLNPAQGQNASAAVFAAIEGRLTPDLEESLEVGIAEVVARAIEDESQAGGLLTSLLDILELSEPDSPYLQSNDPPLDVVISRTNGSKSPMVAKSIAPIGHVDEAYPQRRNNTRVVSVANTGAVDNKGANADSFFAEGEKFRCSGQLDKAERSFNRALEVEREHRRARAQLALVLQTNQRSVEAIRTLEQGLEISPFHLPYLNQLAPICAAIGRFDDAHRYADIGLQHSETLQHEVGFLTQLEYIERRRGNLDGALFYASRLVQLRPESPHFRNLLERLQGTDAEHLLGPDTSQTAPLPWELLPGRLEVSEFLAEDLRREYIKVTPDFVASAPKEAIVDTAVALYKEAVSVSERKRLRPWDEAEKVRTAARLLLDIAERFPSFDYMAHIHSKLGEEFIGEDRDEILRRFMSYFASYLGDHHLGHMRMAAARAYFHEHFRVYGGLRGFSLSVAEKFIRTWVSDADSYRREAQEMVQQKRSRERHRHIPAAVVFQFCLVLERNWHERLKLGWFDEFLRGFLDICRVNEAARGALLHYTEQVGHIVQRAMLLLAESAALDIKSDLAIEWVKEALRQRQDAHDNIFERLKFLRENLLRRSRYSEAILLLGQISAGHLEPTDTRRIGRAQDILRTAERFHSASGFQEKRLLASEIQLLVKSLESEIQAEPTELSRVELGSVLFLTARDVETEFDAFKRRSLPVLDIHVQRTTTTGPSRVCCDVQVDNLGLSPANGVVIEFLSADNGSNIGRLELDCVMPGVSNASVSKVDLVMSTLAPGEAIDVEVAGRYADVDGNSHALVGSSVRVALTSYTQEFKRIRNPYITGPKVTRAELFKGRDRLVSDILEDVTNPASAGAVVMYGQKRSGKSSILYWIGQRAPQWVIPITVDIHSVFTVEASVSSFLYFVAEAITDQASLRCGERFRSIDPSGLLSNPVPTIAFSRFLDQVNEQLGPERRLLLLFDEFTDLTARIEKGEINHGILRYLKSLIEKGTFSCVLCGVDSMPKVLKTYGNDFAVANTRLVTHLDRESAEELVERPINLEDGTSRFTALASDAIVNLAGSYPYFIQLICHRLVEYLNNEQNPDPRITRADIDQCVRQIVEGKAQFNPWITFDSLCRYREDAERDTYGSVLEGWLLYLIADEMRGSQYVPQEALVRRICGFAAFVSADEIDLILNELIDRDVCVMPPATPVRQYRLVVELFARWCAANRPMDEQAMVAFARKLKRLSGALSTEHSRLQ